MFLATTVVLIKVTETWYQYNQGVRKVIVYIYFHVYRIKGNNHLLVLGTSALF